jgi:hypothetical protein
MPCYPQPRDQEMSSYDLVRRKMWPSKKVDQSSRIQNPQKPFVDLDLMVMYPPKNIMFIRKTDHCILFRSQSVSWFGKCFVITNDEYFCNIHRSVTWEIVDIRHDFSIQISEAHQKVFKAHRVSNNISGCTFSQRLLVIYDEQSF